jgi:hypothetical protein
MDEFAPFGYQNFSQILNTARGTNTAFLFSMQSLPQLLKVGKDRSVAGQIAPEFFTRAGEPRQLPTHFVEAVHAVVVAVNCCNCSHSHLLIAPRKSATSPIVLPEQVGISQNSGADQDPNANESMAGAVV